VCVESLLDRRLIILSYHLQTSGDVLVKMCCALDTQFSSHVSIITRAFSIMPAWAHLGSYSQGQLKSAICVAQQKKLLDDLGAKPLHGKFFNWMHSACVSLEKSFQWLQQSLHGELESTLLACNSGSSHLYPCLSSKDHRVFCNAMCRLCGEQEETIQYVLAGCSILAPTSYLSCHDQVARVLHFHLCKSLTLYYRQRVGFAINLFLLLKMISLRCFGI